MSASCIAWCSRSLTSRESRSTRRPFSSATLEWLASVSSRRASCASNVLVSPSRSPTVSVPTTPLAPCSGATMQSRTHSHSRCSWCSSTFVERGTSTTLSSLDHPGPHPLAREELGRHRGLERHVALRAQCEHRAVGVGRLERQLGHVGTKELTGLFEDRLEHRLRALRTTDGLREVVEELQVRVTLPERRYTSGRRVRARPRVGTDQHARGECLANEQCGREREARVAQRRDRAGDEDQPDARARAVPVDRERRWRRR